MRQAPSARPGDQERAIEGRPPGWCPASSTKLPLSASREGASQTGARVEGSEQTTQEHVLRLNQMEAGAPSSGPSESGPFAVAGDRRAIRAQSTDRDRHDTNSSGHISRAARFHRRARSGAGVERAGGALEDSRTAVSQIGALKRFLVSESTPLSFVIDFGGCAVDETGHGTGVLFDLGRFAIVTIRDLVLTTLRRVCRLVFGAFLDRRADFHLPGCDSEGSRWAQCSG